MNKTLFLLSIISATSYAVDFDTLKEKHKATVAPAAIFQLYRKRPYENLKPPIDIDTDFPAATTDKK